MIEVGFSLPLEALAACRFALGADVSPNDMEKDDYVYKRNVRYVAIRRRAVSPRKVEFHLYATDGHRLAHVWWPARKEDVMKTPNNEVYFEGNRANLFLKNVRSTLSILNKQIQKDAKKNGVKAEKELLRDYAFWISSNYEKISREDKKAMSEEQLKEASWPVLSITAKPPSRDPHYPSFLGRMDPESRWIDVEQVIPRPGPSDEKVETAVHFAVDGTYVNDFTKYLQYLKTWFYKQSEDSYQFNSTKLTFYYKDPDNWGPMLITPFELPEAVQSSIEYVLMPVRRH